MLVPAHIFREYDVRGVADRELSDDLVRAIGEAFALTLLEEGPADRLRIAVGRDCRLSSPRIFAALTEGILHAGADVIDVDVGPTPLLYFAVHHFDADGGAVITGSHNARDENGLKRMKGKSSFFAEGIRRLRDRVAVALPVPERESGSLRTVDLAEAYLDTVCRGIDLSGSGLSVVIDAGNGSAGPLGLAAIRKAGLEPEPLFCEMDGEFPNHHPDPTVVENLATLIARVKDSKS